MSTGDEISLGDALDSMFERLKLSDEVVQHRIETAWEDLMNQSIKKRVNRLLFKDGVLIVYVASSTLRNELFMNRYQLRDRLNEKIGKQWIEKVILK